MLPQVLIGLAGPARSGKDTVARHLRDHYRFHCDSFAAPIRRFVCELLRIDQDTLQHIKDQPHPMLGITPRLMMQTLGSEWGRDMIHPDLWLRALISRLHRASQPRVVITDVRFDNEAAQLRALNAVLWHIERPEREAISNATHASESLIAKQRDDLTLYNHGSIDDLLRTIDQLMQ